jgi:hypothetical protein
MIRSFAIVAAATLSLQLCAPPGAAEVLSLAGKSVTIDPISGYCALDKSRTDERLAFSFVEEAVAADSQLLAYWMECTALEAIRNNAGQGPGPYILVMASKKGDRLFRSGHSRQEVVGQARAEIAAVYGQQEFPTAMDGQTQAQLNNTIETFAASSKADGQAGASKFLGFMGRDPEGLYYATAQQNSTNKTAPVLAGVTGLTKVKQFAISAIAYDRYADGQTFLALKDRAQTAVKTLIAANPYEE